MTSRAVLDEFAQLLSHIGDYADELEEAIFETPSIAGGLTFKGLVALTSALKLVGETTAGQYVLHSWAQGELESNDLMREHREYIDRYTVDTSYAIDPRTGEPLEWGEFLPYPECDECDEEATNFWPNLKKPVQLCDSCYHNARRSGWEPEA